MNSKAILGLTLGTVFVFAMIANPVFGSGHLTVTSKTVNAGDAKITLGANVHSAQPSKYGYGFLSTSGGVVALVTHAGADDSDKQGSSPSPAFHTHLVFTTLHPDCVSADNPMGITVDTATPNEVAKFKIKNNMVEVSNLDASAGSLTGTVVTFEISFKGTPTQVCLDNLAVF